MAGGPKGLRELTTSTAAAAELEGLWFSGGLGETPARPPTPLAWQLSVEDALLLGAALSQRGASMPRLSRRLVRLGGYGYQAFAPLQRAARALGPLDASSLALAIAGEVRSEARELDPDRRSPSAMRVSSLLLRAARDGGALERSVLRHERDVSQHYRWLVEMDLGILPDDALGTTLEECAAIARSTRALEIDAMLELLSAFAGLVTFARRTAAIATPQFVSAALVPDALDLPSVTPALALACVAEVEVRRRALGSGDRRAALLDEFVQGFGEWGPHEREPFAPRWRELPTELLGVVEVLVRSGPDATETRLAEARRQRERDVELAITALGAIDSTLFRALMNRARKLVILRSRLHRLAARTLSMLRTAVLDVDRRLVRLVGSDPGNAFFLELRELIESTARPKPELGGRARSRRAAWEAARAEAAPPAAVGRAVRLLGNGAPLTGIGLGDSEVIGRALVARDLSSALALGSGDVLVARSIAPGWMPLLPAAAAVVTDAGGILDEGAIAARALGIPVVLGTADATRRIRTGQSLRVDARAGTVTLE